MYLLTRVTLHTHSENHPAPAAATHAQTRAVGATASVPVCSSPERVAGLVTVLLDRPPPLPWALGVVELS